MADTKKHSFFSREVSSQKAHFAPIQEKVTSVDGDLEKAGEGIMDRILFIVEHPPVGNLDERNMTIKVEGLLDPISFQFVHDGEHGDYVWSVHSVQDDPFAVVVLFEKKHHLK